MHLCTERRANITAKKQKLHCKFEKLTNVIPKKSLVLTNRIAASHGGRDRPPPICKPLWNVAQEITVLYSAFWREIIRPTRVFGGNLSWTAFLTISELRATRKNKTCYQHRKKSKKDFMERHIICWMIALPILNPGKTFCLFYWSFLYVCVNWQFKRTRKNCVWMMLW